MTRIISFFLSGEIDYFALYVRFIGNSTGMPGLIEKDWRNYFWYEFQIRVIVYFVCTVMERAL